MARPPPGSTGSGVLPRLVRRAVPPRWYRSRCLLHPIPTGVRRDYQDRADTSWGAGQPATNEELIARLHPADTEPEPLDVPSTTPPKIATIMEEEEDATISVD